MVRWILNWIPIAELVIDEEKLRGGVRFIDKIPRNELGKIVRPALSKLLWLKILMKLLWLVKNWELGCTKLSVVYSKFLYFAYTFWQKSAILIDTFANWPINITNRSKEIITSEILKRNSIVFPFRRVKYEFAIGKRLHLTKFHDGMTEWIFLCYYHSIDGAILEKSSSVVRIQTLFLLVSLNRWRSMFLKSAEA